MKAYVSVHPNMQPYVSIDIETTGLDPDNDQVLEFGAVIEDWQSPLEDLAYFQCYISHKRVSGDPYALAMNADILRHIADPDYVSWSKPDGTLRFKPDGTLREPDIHEFFEDWELFTAFQQFLSENGLDPKKVTVAGKNFAGFDRQFLRKVPKFNCGIFHHRYIDPAMFYYTPGQPVPSTQECMTIAGIAGDVAHTAMEDARIVIELVRRGCKWELVHK